MELKFLNLIFIDIIDKKNLFYIKHGKILNEYLAVSETNFEWYTNKKFENFVLFQ